MSEKGSLAYRIAKKLIDNGEMKGSDPSDWEIERTYAGYWQKSAGAFAWELVSDRNSVWRIGCYERAFDIVKKEKLFLCDGWRCCGMVIDGE